MMEDIYTLAHKLAKKARAEFDSYVGILKQQNPDYILYHAFEYNVKFDLVGAIEQSVDDPEYYGLTEEKILAMLEEDNLLDELYRFWELRYYDDPSYAEKIHDLISDLEG